VKLRSLSLASSFASSFAHPLLSLAVQLKWPQLSQEDRPGHTENLSAHRSEHRRAWNQKHQFSLLLVL
jgi:hypothetical protein